MRRVFIACLPLAALAAACGGDESQERIASASGTAVIITQPTSWAVPTPTNTYTVVSGDSLWAIARKHCTTVDMLLQLNRFPEFEDHVLQVGEVVSVPGEPCVADPADGDTVDTTANADGDGDQSDGDGDQSDGGDTGDDSDQVASDAEVQRWIDLRGGFVPDPMYGDPSDYHEDFGPVCMAAWGRTYEFEKLGLGRDDVHDALAPLPGRTPADVMTAIDRWAAFTDEWYLRYRQLIDDHSDADGEADYDALVRDRDYREFLAHYLPLAEDQVAAHEYATELCSALLARDGATP
jgi:LysM repeat protein